MVTALLLLFGCKKEKITPEEDNGALGDNYINSIYIDSDGIKYFGTSKGLFSFDGVKWTSYEDNEGIGTGVINDIKLESSGTSGEFWLGTNEGLIVAELPVDAVSGATTYTKSNTPVLFDVEEGLAGDSVIVVQLDENNAKWLGTDGGLSVFSGDSWPEINMKSYYNNDFFISNRITSIECNNDTVYIGTKGGGVARVVSGSVDAITAASPFEIPWSSLASNNILTVFTDGDTQWYGTDSGVTKHVGTNAKSNWESFTKDDGLANNYVMDIVKDLAGNMWFATQKGISVFDGSQWTNYSTSDGLVGNNVICLAVDTDGSLWIGTDNGVSHFVNDAWENYQADL